MPPHNPYYAQRSTEEQLLAAAAADPRVRKVHLEMAVRYALLAGADPNDVGLQDAVGERLSIAAQSG